MKSLTTAWLPAGIDACALWRMYIPHLNMPGSRWAFVHGSLPVELLKGCDVAVVQRLYTDANLAALQQLKRQLGMRIVYDMDDNLWAVPHYNPAYKIFQDAKHQFVRCAILADVFTVSTVGLRTAVATAIPSIKDKLLICPNAYDPRFMRPAPVRRDDGYVLVGWAGSSSHRDDVKDVWVLLEDLLANNPSLKLQFVGGNLPNWLYSNPRVSMQGWVNVAEYPARLASWAWDITLAPLEDNRFNRSKSNIKMLEAAALKIPCLASDVQPYREFCSLNKDLLWLLCANKSDWEKKITLLINDAGAREFYGQLLAETAEKYFSIDVLKSNWEHAVRQACNT